MKSLIKQPIISDSTNRISYIDGIRAIASLNVFFAHFIALFIRNLYNNFNTTIGLLWYNTPLYVLVHGNASVHCFFVLSGFLIARKMYSCSVPSSFSPISVWKKLERIVLPSVFLMFSMLQFFLKYKNIAVALYPECSFAESFINFTPTLRSALYDGILRPFAGGAVFMLGHCGQ